MTGKLRGPARRRIGDLRRRHVLATAVLDRATVPDLPPVPGFIESAFNPLVYQAAHRCLTPRSGDGARTAVVLASLQGDATTTDLASRRLVAGRPHNPLLFMQATANAVLGYLSREFGITGPLLSISTMDNPLAGALTTADLLLADDPELDRVLALGVELAANARTAATYRRLAGTPEAPVPPGTDLAAALLIGRDPAGTPATRTHRADFEADFEENSHAQ